MVTRHDYTLLFTNSHAFHPVMLLAGLDSVWPKLVSLEVSGWAIDASSVTAIRQLEALTSLKLQGGRDPGTALHACLLLPLLDKPGLRKLMLLEVRADVLEGKLVLVAYATNSHKCGSGRADRSMAAGR